jgi:Flp pilus assembly protein CpaB
MRLRLAGGLDLATGALIAGGSVLVAASVVAAVVLLTPPPREPASSPESTPTASARATPSRPSLALPPDKVAAVLHVDAAAGAGGAAQPGDHVDVLGYFSRQVSGADNVTRLLLQDVGVLTVDRSGPGVALTLAVSQDAAILLQEAQALGAHPFVTLRAVDSTTGAATALTTFSDADLAARLAGAR